MLKEGVNADLRSVVCPPRRSRSDLVHCIVPYSGHAGGFVLVSVYPVFRAGFSIGRTRAWSTEFKELEIFVRRHQLVILRLTVQNCCRIPPDGVDVSSPADSIDARPTNAGHARPETPRSDRSSRSDRRLRRGTREPSAEGAHWSSSDS
jgi:hypothetical protein